MSTVNVERSIHFQLDALSDEEALRYTEIVGLEPMTAEQLADWWEDWSWDGLAQLLIVRAPAEEGNEAPAEMGEIGTAASGHRGHQGVKGQRGGSAPGPGGSAEMSAADMNPVQTAAGMALMRLGVAGLTGEEAAGMSEAQCGDAIRGATNAQCAALKQGNAAQIAEASGGAVTAEEAAARIDGWAETSGDNRRDAILIQNAAAAEFGVSPGQHGGAAFEKLGMAKDSAEFAEAQAFVRAQYEQTQAMLADAGIEGEITLYRGVVLPASQGKDWTQGGEVDVTANPLTSWSLSPQVARMFTQAKAPGSATRAVIACKVPVNRIASGFFSGSGTAHEQELVVVGGTTFTARATYVRQEVGEAEDDWLFEYGTAGSGNWGHAGIKGHRGGSLPTTGAGGLFVSRVDRSQGAAMSLKTGPTAVRRHWAGQAKAAAARAGPGKGTEVQPSPGPASTYHAANDIRLPGDITKEMAHLDIGFNGMEDGTLKAIIADQGFDGLPTVVDKLEMQQGETELWRGVSEQRFTDQFREGEYFVGTGVYGNGTYTARAKITADQFSLGKPDCVMHMALRKEARVIDEYDLAAAMSGWHRKQQDLPWDQRIEIDDPGRVAALCGYDAIHIRFSDVGSDDYFVVLNRTALRVEAKQPALSKESAQDDWLFEYGTAGSGNWGHKGIPGHRGGSLPTTGAAMGTSTGPVAMARRAGSLGKAATGGPEKQPEEEPEKPAAEPSNAGQFAKGEKPYALGPGIAISRGRALELLGERCHFINAEGKAIRFDPTSKMHVRSAGAVVSAMCRHPLEEWPRQIDLPSSAEQFESGYIKAGGRTGANSVAGYYESARDRIVLHPDYRNAGVLHHEVGHHVYRKVESNVSWNNAYRKDKTFDRTTKYAKTNAEEGFCEAYSAWMAIDRQVPEGPHQPTFSAVKKVSESGYGG